MVKLPIISSAAKIPRFLTADIGSEFVKCMAFEVSESEAGVTANIVGIGKVRLPHGSTRGGIIVDYDAVEEALSEAIIKATSELDSHVKNIIFGVSGDLSFCSMTTVRLVRGSRDPVHKKELSEIYDRIHEVSFNHAQNDILERTGNSDMDIELVTSSVVYIGLDGKKVKNPVGLEGQKLEIAIFTAFAPSFHTKVLQKLAKRLKLKILAIGSEMYCLVKSIGIERNDFFDCVIMDIGGEVTDVGVVFGGGIVASRSLSIGGYHFTQYLGKETNVTYMDAENKKLDYSFGRLSEDDSLVVQAHFNDILGVWLSGIELLFTDFTGVKTFPSKIYLTGGGAELPDIVDFISAEPWTRSIPFKSPPEFIKLSLKDLPTVADATGSAHSLGDTLPAALSIIFLETNGYLDG